MKGHVRDGILGVAVGDAVGLPVQFAERSERKKHPVTDMTGNGVFHMPAGSWSDDTSLTLCLLDSLSYGKFNPDDIMQRFGRWLTDGEYTPFGESFDIGQGTMEAIERYLNGIPAEQCGGREASNNGNGSLMRILPLSYYLYLKEGSDCDTETIVKLTDTVSALTHAHDRSKVGCGIYIMTAMELLNGAEKNEAVKKTMARAEKYYSEAGREEIQTYHRIAEPGFQNLPEEKINSSGYVVDTLEAALWAFLNTETYRDCVLKTTNLGLDTDSVSAVAGGLAGIYYGAEGIPQDWVKAIRRRDWIEEKCRKMETVTKG